MSGAAATRRRRTCLSLAVDVKSKEANRAMDDLYSPQILSLAAAVPFLGPLAEADVVATATSRICGSRLRLWVRFDNSPAPAIAALGVEIKACALGQAAAAIVLPRLIGLQAAPIRAARDAFQRFLTEQGPSPSAPFDALAVLAPVRDWPARHGAVMLPFEAALKAFTERTHPHAPMADDR